MADALMKIVGLIPAHVSAMGYSHKLPSLKPRAVNGYDLVDTEILFSTGAVAHIITGWALPNTAWSTTVQSGRLICSEGMLDLGLDTPGLREIHAEGFGEINPLFRNFENNGTVTGYGIDSPGRFYRQILARRTDRLSTAGYEEALSPMALGFYSTLVIEAAEKSLAEGKKLENGATWGAKVNLRELVAKQIGEAAAREYGMQ
jgi:hypothetical protein